MDRYTKEVKHYEFDYSKPIGSNYAITPATRSFCCETLYRQTEYGDYDTPPMHAGEVYKYDEATTYAIWMQARESTGCDTCGDTTVQVGPIIAYCPFCGSDKPFDYIREDNDG